MVAAAYTQGIQEPFIVIDHHSFNWVGVHMIKHEYFDSYILYI